MPGYITSYTRKYDCLFYIDSGFHDLPEEQRGHSKLGLDLSYTQLICFVLPCWYNYFQKYSKYRVLLNMDFLVELACICSRSFVYTFHLFPYLNLIISSDCCCMLLFMIEVLTYFIDSLLASICSSENYASEGLESSEMDSKKVMHSGGCHCRRVRWKVEAPASVVVWKCDCSNCFMRGNAHFIVPAEKFELLGDSKEFLTTYTFGTHTAKHTFCKICGITSFYIPRSNQDGVAVSFMCVDLGTLTHVEIKNFDGKNWENSYIESNIASCSKVQNEEIV